MKSTRHLLILVFCIFTFNAVAQVEESDQKRVVVTTKDGSVIYGQFVDRDEISMTVMSISLAKVVIPISEIENIKYYESIGAKDKSGFIVDYHNSTRYFLSPSAYSLKKGQSYFENVWIFWNSYAIGVTDNITLSASTEIISLLFNQEFPLIFLNAKFSLPFKGDTGALGVNLSYLTVPNNSFSSYTFLTGAITLGSRNNNVTLGIGGGFQIENGITDEVLPVNLSLMTRLTEKISFVSENWLVTQNDFSHNVGIISAGLRIHFKHPGSALNISLVRPIDGDINIIGLPFVSATVGLN